MKQQSEEDAKMKLQLLSAEIVFDKEGKSFERLTFQALVSKQEGQSLREALSEGYELELGSNE